MTYPGARSAGRGLHEVRRQLGGERGWHASAQGGAVGPVSLVEHLAVVVHARDQVTTDVRDERRHLDLRVRHVPGQRGDELAEPLAGPRGDEDRPGLAPPQPAEHDWVGRVRLVDDHQPGQPAGTDLAEDLLYRRDLR